MSSRKSPALSKAKLVAELAERTELSKSQISAVFDAYAEVVKKELRAKRPVTLLGLAKAKVVHREAKPARPGRNPATGETIMLKAKPARSVVKVTAVKALKDMV